MFALSEERNKNNIMPIKPEKVSASWKTSIINPINYASDRNLAVL